MYADEPYDDEFASEPEYTAPAPAPTPAPQKTQPKSKPNARPKHERPKQPEKPSSAQPSPQVIEKMKTLETKVAELQSQLVQQETILKAEAQATVAELEAKALAAEAALKAELDVKSSITEALQRKLENQESELVKVSSELKESQQKCEELEQERADAKDIQEYQRAVDAAQIRIAALQTELNRGEVDRSEEVHALETTNATLRRELRTVRGELELSQASVADARQRLQQYQQSHLAHREDYINAASTSMAASSESDSAAASAVPGAGMNANSGLFRLEKKVREQASEIRRLELALSASHEDAVQAEQEAAKRATKLGRVQTQLRESERTGAELQQRVISLQNELSSRAAPSSTRFGQQLATAKAELAHKTEDLHEARRDLEKAHSELQQLRTRLRDSASAAEIERMRTDHRYALRNAEQRIKEQENATSAALSQYNELKRQLDLDDQNREQRNDNKTRILRKKLELLEAEVADARTKMRARDVQISRLREEAQRAEERHQRQQKELARLKVDLQQRDQQLQNSRESCENTEIRAQSIQKSAEDKDAKLRDSEESRRALQAELEEATSKMRSLQEDLRNQRAAHADLKIQLSNAHQQLKLVEESRDGLERRVKDAQWLVEQSKREAEAKLLEEQTALKKQLADRDRELQSLRWFKQHGDGQHAALAVRETAELERWKKKVHLLREQLQQRVSALHAQQVTQYEDIIAEKEVKIRDLEEHSEEIEVGAMVLSGICKCRESKLLTLCLSMTKGVKQRAGGSQGQA